MSHESFERSRQTGQPINLLKFKWSEQDGGVLGYTDADRIITFDDGTDNIAYQPITIESPAIKASGSYDRQRIEFGLPKTVPIAALYKVFPPTEITTLRVYQGHRNDPNQDYKVVWAGRVLGINFDSPMAKFICEPVSSASKRIGLRASWQYGCRHALYGSMCGASRAAATTQVVFDEESNSELASSGDTFIRMPVGFPVGDTPASAYLQGVVYWCVDRGTIIRTIIRVSAPDSNGQVVLRLNGPTTDLAVGVTLNVVLGCNHMMNHCDDLHNNLPNFGGYPFIPNENPLSGSKNPFY